MLSRTVSELLQLIVQILDTLHFEPPFGTTYNVHLGLIRKRVVDFLSVLIELFSLGVTAELLRAKIDRKSTISLQHCNFDPKFQVEGDVPPPIIFAWIVRPINALQLCPDSFHIKLCSRLSSSEVRF